jgi:hypothetical protein
MTAAPTIADRRDLEASLDSSSSRPRASVIVLSLNGQEYIRGCLQSLSESELRSLEIIVVNNGSTDATQEIVANEFPNVRLVNLPKNMGFAGGINEGLKRARGDVLIPLNDDTICTPGVVGRLVETLDESSDIGIVGCKILYPDKKTLQHAGGWINPNGKTHHFGYREVDEGQYDQRRDVDYVTGCMFAIRRELLERIGMLDDRYFPIYYEEVEFAVRARKNGYRARRGVVPPRIDDRGSREPELPVSLSQGTMAFHPQELQFRRGTQGIRARAPVPAKGGLEDRGSDVGSGTSVNDRSAAPDIVGPILPVSADPGPVVNLPRSVVSYSPDGSILTSTARIRRECPGEFHAFAVDQKSPAGSRTRPIAAASQCSSSPATVITTIVDREAKWPIL